MKYQQCKSCKTVIDELGIQITPGEKGLTMGLYQTAVAAAEPFVCGGCEVVARHQMPTTPPDPSTYQKLNR